MYKLLFTLLFILGSIKGIAADFYWVNGTGNWSDYPAHWATTSGGSTMQTNAPTINDDVFFDSNSFTTGGQTVTVDIAASCKTIDWTGTTNTPTFLGTASDTLSVYGSFLLSSAMNYNYVGELLFYSTLKDTINTQNNIILGNSTFLNSDSLQLLNNYTSTGNIEFTRGTLFAQNFNITCARFNADYTTNRTLSFTSGNLILTGDSLAWKGGSLGFNYVPGSGNIQLNYTGNNKVFFKGAFLNYNDVTVNVKLVQFEDAATFNNLIINAGTHLIFPEFTAQNFNALTANGTCGLPIFIEATQNIMVGSQATLNSTGGAVTSNYLRLKNIEATGASFTANNSIDEGNNTGWTINGIANSSDMYWISATGSWNDPTHWSYTSGGASAGCIPGPNNNVFFDANSGFVNDTVFILKNAYCNNMDWTGTTNNPILTGDSLVKIQLQGSMVLTANLVANFKGVYEFNSTTLNNINLQTVILNGETHFLNTGQWTLQNDFNSNKNIRFNEGTFNTNNFNLALNGFIANTTTARTLTLGSSTFLLSGTDSTWAINNTALTFLSGTSIIELNSLNNLASSFYGGTEIYNALIINCTNAQVWDANTFNLVEVKKGKTLSLASGTTQMVDSLIAIGSCDSLITLQSTANFSTPAQLQKTGFDSLTVSNCLIKNIDAVVTGTEYYLAQSSNLQNSTANWDTIATAASNTYYWIGNTGNWSDINNWSLSSGGVPSSCLPTILDTVIFDANSFSANGQTTTLDVDGQCAKMDWSGITFNPIFDFKKDLNVGYQAILNNNLTVTRNNTSSSIYFIPKGNSFFDSQGADMDINFIYTASALTDTLFLQSKLDLSPTGTLVLTQGSYISNADTVIAGSFLIFTDNPKLINLNNTYHQLTYSWNASNLTLTTLNSGTSFIDIIGSPSADVFNGNGFSYYDVQIASQGSVTQLSGANTFNKLTFKPGLAIDLEQGVTQTVIDSFITIGTCNDSIIIHSSLAGSQSVITQNTAKTKAECLSLRDINVTGATTFFSTNQGNNTGWIFNTSPATTANSTSIFQNCLGNAVNFTNTSTAFSGNFSDLNFYWEFGNGDTSIVASPTYTYPVNGLYYVTLVSEYLNGCKDTLIDSVNVNDPQVTLFSSDIDTIICAGDSVTFTTSTTLDSYQFYINSTAATGMTASNLFTSGNINNGDTIWVKGILNGCPVNGSDKFIFTVNTIPPLILNLSSGSDTICSADVITFTASGANLYQFFYNGVAQTSNSSTDSLVMGSFSSNDSVYVIGSYTGSGCSTQSSTHIFTVNPMPNTALTNLNGSNVICQGDVMNFSASGAETYQFYINGSNQGVFSATNTFSTTNINNGDTIKVIGDSLGCQTLGTPEFIIAVNPIPTVLVTPSDTDLTICTGDNLAFSATGAAIYEFYVNGTSQGAPSGSNNFSSSAFNNGDTVIVRGETFGCIGYGATDTVSVVSLPTVNLSNNDPDTIICLNDLVTFTASGAVQYQFLVNGVPVTTQSATNTYTTDSIQNGQIVSVIGFQNGCDTFSIESYTFTVKPIPNINLVTSDTLICEGDNATFTAVGGTTYEFFVDGVSQGAASASNIFSSSTLPSGTPIVTVTGFLNGCANTGNQSYNVIVKPKPTVGLTTSASTICDGDSIVFTASNATTYQFTIDGVAQGPFSGDTTFTSSAINNGQQIGVTGALNGCFNTSDSVYTITVNPLPTTSLTSSDLDNIICEGDAITFTGSGAANYEFFIDTISLGSSVSPTYITDSLQTGQTISLMGYTANGCQLKALATFTITVNPLPNISMIANDPDTTICVGDNIEFTASGSNLYEFFLNGISTGAISPTNTYNNSALTNGDVITVIGQTNFGCSNNGVDTFIVNVNPTPTVSLLSSDLDQQICVGDTVIFSATGATNYEFFVNNISQGTSSLIDSLILSNLNNGDIVTVLGETNNCPSNGDSTYTFNVFSYPIVTLSTLDSINNSCVGDTLNFTANGALTYEFFVNGISQGVPTLTNTFSSFGLTNGQILSVTGYNNGCAANADTTYTLGINSYPTVVLSSTPTASTICFGDTVNFNATGANQYAFYLNQLQETVITTNNTYQNNELESGDTIKVIGYNGKCASTIQSITFTVKKMNLTLSSPLPNMLCSGSSNTYAANGADLYQFSLNGSAVGGFSSTNTYSTAFNDGDVISVAGQNTTTGCTQQGTDVIISVYQNPIVTPTGPIQICDGDSAQLFSNISFGNQWYESGNSILSENDSSYWVTSSGSYSVAATQGGLGSIWSAGNNANGQLGDSTTIGSQLPIIANNIVGATAIASGINHNIIVKNDGTIWAWGDNSLGQMGDGTFSDVWSPKQVVSITTANNVSAGDNFCLVLLNAGTLMAFGDNTVGQLGLGTNGISNFPVAIPNLTNVTAITGGGEFSLALDNAGTVWSWGKNNFGQLGNGTNTNSNTPNQIPPLTNIIAISAGRNHALALKNDGTVWAWGDNSQGQLGISGINFTNIPVQIGTFNNITAISAGADHSLMLDNKNNAYAFGNNVFGQLGLSNSTNFDTPQKINNQKFVQINAAYFNSFALKADSSVWAWGKNQYGQLGNLQQTNLNSPTYIKNYNGAKAIAGGEEHTAVLMSRENSCPSNIVQVLIDTIGPIVINVINDTTLTTPTVGTSYQWYLNGNLIPGATSNTWNPTITGDYSVEITSASGCSLISNEILWSPVGIEVYFNNNTLTVYPNPSKGIFNITIENNTIKIKHIQLFNFIGKEFYLQFDNNKFNINDLPNGIYFIKITLENNQQIIKKIIKEI